MTPVEYTTYGCQYRCGYRHKKMLQKVAQHEKICWKNPVNKTCYTCKYCVKGCDYDEFKERKMRYLYCESHEENISKCDLDGKFLLSWYVPEEHCKDWQERIIK